MGRFGMVAILMVVVAFYSLDDMLFRSLTAVKDVQSLAVKDGSQRSMELESQEVVNNDSMESYAERAVVMILNYRPGKAVEHIEGEAIKSLFIAEEYYDAFKKPFLSWSDREFRVNNISIKEAIATNGKLYSVGGMQGGARVWRYDATVPILNRAVGGNAVERMRIELYLVYLGYKGGLGVFAVKLS
jgi:hypothetical protein